MKNEHKNLLNIQSTSRKDFLKQSGMLGGLLLTNPAGLFAEDKYASPGESTISSKGYAARDSSGKLSSWSFERRGVGSKDVRIDIKYCGVCHSDIHQLKGDWGPQKYPQVPGHEIVGVVSAVGDEVKQFSVGDRAGVGCMVDSCGTCDSCISGEEQHCDNNETLFTYGYPDPKSPTGITQGGYATNIVVKEDFVIRIPDNIRMQDAAPLLCAGITTYSPLMRVAIEKGDKVGVAGIGGLGHMAIKLAVSKGAEVYAFTTSESKVEDILSFGAKEAIYVESMDALHPYNGMLDYMISTIPVNYNVSAYASLVKPYGQFTQVGMPAGGQLDVNSFAFSGSRVNFNASLIGGIPETQEVVNYCAQKEIHPQIDIIDAKEVNTAWEKVLNKEARYRYVIDSATI